MRRERLRWFLWGGLGIAIVVFLLVALLAGRRAADTEVGRFRGGVERELPVIAEVSGFELVDHAGRRVTPATLAGTPWVVDFIFTRCRSTCPLMTEAMRRLRAAWPHALPVRFVSISVDPEHDRPQVLARYRREHGIEGDDWLFLTGERDAVHRLVSETFLLPFDRDPPPELATPEMPILHSTRFVLVDARGRIRGYYDGLDRRALDRIPRDVHEIRTEHQNSDGATSSRVRQGLSFRRPAPCSQGDGQRPCVAVAEDLVRNRREAVGDQLERVRSRREAERPELPQNLVIDLVQTRDG